MLPSPSLRIMNRSGGQVSSRKRIVSPAPPDESEDNNNQTPTKTPRRHRACTPTKIEPAATCSMENARTFCKWFQQMLDEDRHNLMLYLADEVVLEWFGRTIRTRRKVAGFLDYDMQCSRHNFTTMVECAPFVARADRSKGKVPESSSNEELATPIEVPQTPTAKIKSPLARLKVCSTVKKRQGLRSDSVSPEKRCLSPQWEANSLKHGLDCEAETSEKKRAKRQQNMEADFDSGRGKSEAKNRGFVRKLRFDDAPDEGIDCNKKFTTPVKREMKQGDCLATASDDARNLLIRNLPRKYVECNGFVEFMRSKNRRTVDSMKWERKCKVQVCYTEDPVNVGEYTIWTIIYSDNIKCKRNLLPAFEEVAKEESAKRRLF